MPRRSSVSSQALRALATWLRAHHGVVSATQLQHLGIPRHYAASRVRSGRWQRLHNGVFLAHSGPVGWTERCAAALAALGPDATLDADSAVIAWDLDLRVDRSTVHVLLPRGGARRSLSGVSVRYSDDARPRASLLRRGLPTLRLEHALVVVARRRPQRARGVLSFAVQSGRTTADRLVAAVLAAATTTHRDHLRAVLDDIAGGTRSELEGRFLDAARRGGLPLPTRNVAVCIRGRRLWIDLAYPAPRIAIEIDGKAYHVVADDWEDDLERQNDIVLDGWLVLRFTARALRDAPGQCVRRVAEAIALRTAELGLSA